jgi:hypothetical protein
MPSLTVDRFEFGIDHRKGKAATDANRLRACTNAYITAGRQIKKRGCLKTYATLEAGTVGLAAGKTKLLTFYGGTGTITHANTAFQATRLMHPTTPALAVSRVHFVDTYDGYTYAACEYTDQSVYHHWVNDPGAWAATTAYALGTFRRPIAANGFLYEVTAVSGTGTSGGAEPAWPTTPGLTVVDNAGPNQLTWTCRTYAVLDSSNPKSKSLVKLSDRLFAIGSEVVRYCSIGNPRQWNGGTSGFLPVGRHATGDVDPTAVAVYSGNLAVFFRDSMQLWSIDPSPSLMALSQSVPNVGTSYHLSPITVGRDLFFLTAYGFRSVGIITDTGNYQDADVGSPIDTLVRAEISASDIPYAVWYGPAGQAWWIFTDYAWVFTFSKTGKISAWSRYEFPFAIEAACIFQNVMYLRNGNNIYTLSESEFTDDITDTDVRVELPYLDGGKPGVMKMVYGFDIAAVGTAQLSFKWDPNDETRETIAVDIGGVTRLGGMQPVELCCTEIAPVITHSSDEAFELHSLTIHYHELGQV